MTTQDVWFAMSVAAFVLAVWRWVEDRNCTRRRESLGGLDRQRWDRLVPDGDRPEIRIGPVAREAAKPLLELAIDGGREDLADRCRGAAGEAFAEAIEACRLVTGYLVIDQCLSWPVSDERLRRVADNVQDGLLPAEITRREIRDRLRDALTGPHRRDAEGRLPGSVFPGDDEAALTFLVTGWLLSRCCPKGWTWPDYLDWVCDLLNIAGDMPLHRIPALIQHLP